MRRVYSVSALSVLLTVAAPLAIPQFSLRSKSAFFVPANRLSGIGADRDKLTELILTRRTELMIDSQTFGILRDSRALAGAQRINGPKLQAIFRDAGHRSGLPPELIAAVAYLESWGDATAESPAGPKGIMQFSEATARQNGLRIFRTTRYRTVTEKRQVKGKRGKIITRTVTRKVPYTVVSRDERFQPERAVPAAAMYLAQMERKFGGRDWAVFAYHCGEGCVSNIQAIFSQTNEYKQGERSVARMFFAANPAHNRELYETLRYHMERDYSPTYWFRIMRAQSLLALYKEDPETFAKLTMEYKYQSNPSLRAPHRLSVWLKPEDLMYQTCDDIRRDMGTKLARAVDNPEYFGFTLRKSGPGAIGEGDPGNADVYMQASPAALGTLMYIAYETRRLHEELHPKGEKFVPIEVTSLVRPKNASDKGEAPTHCSGQVFDISSQNLPPGERECLQFVLDDIGWNGYLGFVQEANDSNTLHVGCAPGAREFFSKVFEESSAPAKPSAE